MTLDLRALPKPTNMRTCKTRRIYLYEHRDSGFYSPKFEVEIGPKFPHFWVQAPLTLGAPFLFCLPSMALSAPFPSPFFSTQFPMFYPPFPPHSLLPFSFFPFPFSRASHPARGSSQTSSVSSSS